jgi:hypothetical protein
VARNAMSRSDPRQPDLFAPWLGPFAKIRDAAKAATFDPAALDDAYDRLWGGFADMITGAAPDPTNRDALKQAILDSLAQLEDEVALLPDGERRKEAVRKIIDDLRA